MFKKFLVATSAFALLVAVSDSSAAAPGNTGYGGGSYSPSTSSAGSYGGAYCPPTGQQCATTYEPCTTYKPVTRCAPIPPRAPVCPPQCPPCMPYPPACASGFEFAAGVNWQPTDSWNNLEFSKFKENVSVTFAGLSNVGEDPSSTFGKNLKVKDKFDEKIGWFARFYFPLGGLGSCLGSDSIRVGGEFSYVSYKSKDSSNSVYLIRTTVDDKDDKSDNNASLAWNNPGVRYTDLKLKNYHVVGAFSFGQSPCLPSCGIGMSVYGKAGMTTVEGGLGDFKETPWSFGGGFTVHTQPRSSMPGCPALQILGGIDTTYITKKSYSGQRIDHAVPAVSPLVGDDSTGSDTYSVDFGGWNTLLRAGVGVSF